MGSAQPQFQARDAYSSATFLCVLMAAFMAIQLVATSSAGLGPFVLALRLLLLGLSLGSLAYLLATGRHPSERAALVITLTLMALTFPLTAVAAPRWADVGRPWEVFPGLHLAM